MLSKTARRRSGSAEIRGRSGSRRAFREMPCAFACPSTRRSASAITGEMCTGSRLSRSSPASMRVRSRNSWTVSVSCSTPMSDVATSSRCRLGKQIGRLLQHQQRHPERRQRRLELVRGHGDQLRTHLVEANEIGDVVQQQDRASLLRIRVPEQERRAAAAAARRRPVPREWCGSRSLGGTASAPAAMALAHGIEVQPIDSEIVETAWFVHACRAERPHRRPVHRLDLPGGVEQHDGVRQRLERRFERVLGPHDLADVRAPELGEILRHLIECGRQFAELVSRRRHRSARRTVPRGSHWRLASAVAPGPRRCASDAMPPRPRSRAPPA